MKLLEKIYSKLDNTIKYILQCDDNLIIEISYINKNDGKDIICVPTQTSCIMGCKFCHISDVKNKIINRNLKVDEITDSVEIVYNDLELYKDPKVLLISYMGCGEPLLNENTVYSMIYLSNIFELVPLTRFAIATSLPNFAWVNFFDLTNIIIKEKLQVKLHLSLHYTLDNIRKNWMPLSLEIIPSIVALEFYKKVTGNSVEIHYTLIEGINDSEQDAILLTELIKNRDIPVKFLFFNEKPSLDYKSSKKDKLNIFRKYFDRYNIQYEYYVPPGLDVGASCGQFLMDYYYKYNKKEEINDM